MEIRQLRYFEAVARHRHFTRAAAELNIAQSALSHQVGALERELGIELLSRTTRSVQPTEAGELVAARARTILAEADALRGDVDELRGLVRGHVAVGALLFGGGSLDVAFALEVEPPDGLDRIALSREELAVVMSRDHRLAASTRPLRPAAVAREPLIAFQHGSSVRRLVDDAFARAGVEPQIALEGNDLALVRSLVARGIGLAVLPRTFAELPGPPIALRPLSPPMRLTVALWWRRGRRLSPAARALVDFARATAQRAGGARAA
jgi:LysR family transcriptional activator of glutamate synthase operon